MQMIDHIDMITMFQEACSRGDREMAEKILYAMHDACPYQKAECLNTKFCPDCEFYKTNGGVWKLKL